MDVDVVIIGLNSSKTLQACLESVLATHYPQIHLFYVDGGSTDSSVQIARQFPTVKILELKETPPTPGRGRNRGWQVGSSPFVQFLDADTLLEPNWLPKALAVLDNPEVGAVCGDRRELFPQQSSFNWIGDQEWNEGEAFGGDVLIRRELLQKTGGYNEMLVAGEDPEFSFRIASAGWKIVRLKMPMTRHDLAMMTFRQYWKRAYRTGYAYAAVNALHKGFWKKECFRIGLRGGGFLLMTIAALFHSLWWGLPALMLLFYPRLFRVAAIQKAKSLSLEEAQLYAWHCSLVAIPQFFGMVGSSLQGGTQKQPNQWTK